MHSIQNEAYNSDPFDLEIFLVSEVKLYKREVYTFLNMLGDIGGLYDGLLILTCFLLTSYNASMFELEASKTLFKF